MCLFLQMSAERSGAGGSQLSKEGRQGASVGESRLPRGHLDGCDNMFWVESAVELVEVLFLNAPLLELMSSRLSPVLSPRVPSHHTLLTPNWKEQKETAGFILTHPGSLGHPPTVPPSPPATRGKLFPLPQDQMPNQEGSTCQPSVGKGLSGG